MRETCKAFGLRFSRARNDKIIKIYSSVADFWIELEDMCSRHHGKSAVFNRPIDHIAAITASQIKPLAICRIW